MAVAPQNIMAQLRGMPDAQLAQYAAMHKNDPFIFPLAFQESQSRKQLRASQQAQMAGQEQPKVVDQAVSQMMPQQAQLPEDTGIGQLPAKNLQRMAGGGIVAFEEGGEVPRYNGATDYKSLVDSADLQAKRMRGYGLTDAEKTQLITSKSLQEKQRAAAFAAAASGAPYDPSAPLPAPAVQPALNQTAAETARLRSQTQNAVGVPTGPVPDVGAGGAAETPADNQARTRSVASPKAAQAAAPTPGLPGLTEAYKAPTAAELGISAKDIAKATNAESDTAYKPYAEMLQKERADLASRSSENKNMALLQAGLGIMSGTSRYAMENIGKGGMQGLAAFQEAKRLDDASKKALMGSEIALMQAQRAERSGNHKDAVALIGQAEQGKQFGINAGLKAEELKNTKAYQQGALANQRAQIDLSASKLDLMRDAYGIKEKQILAKYAQQAETNLVKSDPMWSQLTDEVKRQKVQSAMRTLLSADPNYAHLASNIGFTPTANSSLVRTLNKDDE